MFPTKNEPKIRSFIDELHDYPIVFVDDFPFQFEQERSSHIAFVGFDSAEGGRIAARVVCGMNMESEIRNVLIVTAAGSQPDRAACFKSLLKAEFDPIISEVNGDNNRNQVAECVCQAFDNAQSKGNVLDVVFCVNETSTLGCMDAVQRITARGQGGAPKVIGYDGTNELTRLAQERGCLKHIVVQDHDRLAEASVHRLCQMLKGKHIDKEPPIPPELVIFR
jgi:ABC-type sugar transport system substrate-binding protein